MLYMVIERYKTAGGEEIYRRVKEKGRQLPEGLEYVLSWIDRDFTICFQIMRTENEQLFSQWIAVWEDLVDFQVIPVITSAEAMQMRAESSM